MQASLPPFSCSCTREVPELLAQLNCSLAVSTYQAGKVILISSDGQQLSQLPRNFDTPMGLAVEDSRLAVATRHEILLLANESRLARNYPSKPGHYDALFVPRSAQFCGQLNVHDMAWAKSQSEKAVLGSTGYQPVPSGNLPDGTGAALMNSSGAGFDATPAAIPVGKLPTGAGRLPAPPIRALIGVNTLFSCLFRLDELYSFVPVWQPPFISALASEDRCHLNGLALLDDEPRYVTALGQTDGLQGWRENKLKGGVLMDIRTNEVIAPNLPMPHSPRVFDGRLYVLLSATGELALVDQKTGSYEVVNRMPGFVRGLARHRDYLFIGSSHLRKSHTFGDLPLAQKDATVCGVMIVHLQTGALVGQIKYINSCEEIYDVQVLPDLRRPGILGTHDPTYQRALSIPEATFWGENPQNEARALRP